MALDTADKRFSAIHIGSPWRGILPFPDGDITSAGDRQTIVFLYSGISAGAAVVTISVTLTDVNNDAIPNLSGLIWAWWDDPIVNTQVAPVVTGTGATTDASGVFEVTLTGTALTAGGVGWVEITDSDGTVSQSPIGKVAAGPVTVQ
jgi:hypothetical protein